MRESRLYGSEGGGAYTLPTPIIYPSVPCRAKSFFHSPVKLIHT